MLSLKEEKHQEMVKTTNQVNVINTSQFSENEVNYLKKMMNNKNYNNKRKGKGKFNNNKKGACFNCGKLGHYAVDCYSPKQNKANRSGNDYAVKN